MTKQISLNMLWDSATSKERVLLNSNQKTLSEKIYDIQNLPLNI
ncbi:hypothetical protein Cal6303_2803 [Calothrix sp. PCC 6303]|nr:hypothetical protein Cal6303_2803 [Calothrix sp. PCC 6303]